MKKHFIALALLALVGCQTPTDSVNRNESIALVDKADIPYLKGESRDLFQIFSYKGKTYITSCGPEDEHYLNSHTVTMSELKWAKQN